MGRLLYLFAGSHVNGQAAGCEPTDGTREVIKDRYNGLIVDYNNPNDLANRYYELLHDEPLRKKLGAAARLFVESRFDSCRVSKKVTDIYTGLFSH